MWLGLASSHGPAHLFLMSDHGVLQRRIYDVQVALDELRLAFGPDSLELLRSPAADAMARFHIGPAGPPFAV